MSLKNTIFHKQNQTYLLDFSAEEISSDSSVFLAEKIERKHHIIKHISSFITDNRDPYTVVHSYESILKQRVFMMMQGYEDANDVQHLKNDPIIKTVLGGDLASQPTVSRFENHIGKQAIFRILYGWLDRYVKNAGPREQTNM